MNNNSKKQKVRKGGGFGFEETNREAVLQKTADILAKVKGTFIRVQANGFVQETDVQEDAGGYQITIGAKVKEQEESKTKFERAVAPILFNTSKNLFNNQKVDLTGFAQDKHQSALVDIADGVYSGLEQRRVNSMMGYLYKGYNERYQIADQQRAERDFADIEIDNPAVAIQAANLGLYDKVAKSQFPEANEFVKAVERTGPSGSLILTKDYIDRIVKPWYKENFDNEPEEPQGQGQGQGQQQGQEGQDGESGESGEQGQSGESGESGEDSESEDEGQEDGEGQGQGQSGQSGDGNAEPQNIDPETGEIHSGDLNKHAGEKNWKGDKPSEAQKKALDYYGYNGETPETKGDASDLISDIKSSGNEGERAEELSKEFPKQMPNSGQGEEDGQSEDCSEPANWNENDMELKNQGDITESMRNQVDPARNMQGRCEESNTDQTDLESSRTEGMEELEKIEDAINEITTEDAKDESPDTFELDNKHGFSEEELGDLTGNIKPISMNRWGTVDPDRQVVNKLKALFKRVKGKSKMRLTEDGNEVDIDMFIKNRTEGGQEFLLESTPQHGFLVVIGVDESGSMGGQRMNIARQLCGTLYKAFEEMHNVEIHVIGWASSGGTKVHIIKSFEDVATLRAYGGTPFREATMYIADYVKKQPQKKKLFFQITDGDVDYDEKMMRFMQNMRRDGIITTGIQVNDYGDAQGSMTKLFGKGNFLQFSDMADVKKILIKQIAKQMMRFMK
jgi:hypothetical protein